MNYKEKNRKKIVCRNKQGLMFDEIEGEGKKTFF